MALSGAAPTIVPQPEPVPVPPVMPEKPPYLSEVPRANLKPELFERATRATTDLAGLFGTPDYPLEAIKNEEQGTVAVVLRVGADGRLADCIVSVSSGSPSLDLQTCRVFWTRARFQPARDDQGRPVESALRQRVRWELPEASPVPFKPWSARYVFEFVEHGGLISCRAELGGALRGKDTECGIAADLWQSALGNLRTEAGYKRRTFIFEVQFTPENLPVAVQQPPGMQIIGRQVARLTIDASGEPLKCSVEEESGPRMPEGCDDLLDDHFEMPGIAVGAVEATVVRTAYLSD